MRFSVEVEKSYVSRKTGDRVATIHGHIAVEADDLTSAIRIVNGMMACKPGCLQTTDPRIKWDGDPPKGAEYEDFSFETTGETV